MFAGTSSQGFGFFFTFWLAWLEIAFGKSTEELKSQKVPQLILKGGVGVSGD